MHKECNKLVVTQLTRAHIGYIGSVVPLPSRPTALGPKSLLSQYIPCVTTITYIYRIGVNSSGRVRAAGKLSHGFYYSE